MTTESIQKVLNKVIADTADNMEIMTGDKKHLAILIAIYRVLVLMLRYMLSK